MASAPKKVTSNTVKTVGPGGTKTVKTTKTVQGGNTATTRTTTISKPKKAAKKTAAQGTKSKAGGKTAKKTAPKAPAKAAGTLVASEWITGPNDGGWTLCGPVAVANALLAATGIRATNGDLERLYRAAGATGDTGAPLEYFLAAAATTGLAGCRLASYPLTTAVSDADVLLLTVAGVPDLHAAAIHDGQVITWGAAVPLGDLNAQIHDAWSLTWQ